MSKFSLFVSVYTVLMLALFFTFCFLMTRINPPPIKQDPEQSRRFGSDNLIYSDEFLPNDNLAYGLEKVEGDYDSIDIFPKQVIENRRNIPKIYMDQNLKTNCTRQTTNKVTKSMKHIKGLRRSIKESQHYDTIPRAVHLKIKDLNGQPRIEIKVVQEKSKNKKIRKYRSSANINNTIKFYIDNEMSKIGYDNSSKEVIVVIENNEKLVLDFANDYINLYDDYINNIDMNDKNNSETNISHLFNKSIENFTEIYKAESNRTNMEESTESMNKSGKSDIKNMAVTFNNVTVDKETKMASINDSSKGFNETESYESKEETQPLVIPGNTLVGLLIPEATATLPFNYHFIN